MCNQLTNICEGVFLRFLGQLSSVWRFHLDCLRTVCLSKLWLFCKRTKWVLKPTWLPSGTYIWGWAQSDECKSALSRSPMILLPTVQRYQDHMPITIQELRSNYQVVQVAPYFMLISFQITRLAIKRAQVVFAKGKKGHHMFGNWIWSFISRDYTEFLKHHPTKWKLKQKYVSNSSSWTLTGFKEVQVRVSFLVLKGCLITRK